MKLTVTQANAKSVIAALTNNIMRAGHKQGMRVTINADRERGTVWTTATGTGSIVTRVTVPDAEVIEGGTVALDAVALDKVIKALPKRNTIEFAENGKSLRYSVQGTSISGRFETYNDDSPQVTLSEEKPIAIATMGTEILARLIDSTLYAVSKEDDRPILKGVCVECIDANNSVTFASVDGYRLGAAETHAMVCNTANCVIPGDGLKLVRKLLPKKDAGKVTLFVYDGYVRFTFGDFEINAKTLEGDFVQWRDFFPAKSSTVAHNVDRTALIDALKRVIAVGSTRAEYSIDADGLMVSTAVDSASLCEMLPASVRTVHGLRITLNAHYMIDALSAMMSEKVTLSFNDPVKPCVIVDAEHAQRALILPIMVQGTQAA